MSGDQPELLTTASGATEAILPTISIRFNASDANVTFRSHDGVLFRVHRKNLEVNTGAFPPAEVPTNGEVVALTEPAETLEILFQFIYPQRHPDLEDVDIKVLSALAEAVEKYEVYPALTICKIRMERFVQSNPIEALVYALRHHYEGLINKAAPLIMVNNIDVALPMLAPDLHGPCVGLHGSL